MASAPAVSVVMPTWNRLSTLGKALDGLATQTVGPEVFEVVVVSDGSTDGTDSVVGQMETPFHLVFASQPNSGPAAARNRGVQLASGDLVLFVDDDVVALPHLVEQHLAGHARAGDRAVVVGPMLNPPDYRLNPFVRWEQAMLYKQYEAMERGDWAPTYRQFYTGNASLRRDFLLDVGLFDERFRRAEDVELAYRLSRRGAVFVFDKHAGAHHYAQRSFASWRRNAREYGRNDVIFQRERGDSESLSNTRREYAERNALVRMLTRSCVGRPRLEASLRWPVRAGVGVGDALKLEGVTLRVLSGLYNASYYCGMADEMGGPDRFWELVCGAST